MMCPGKSSPGDMLVTACEVARYVCRNSFTPSHLTCSQRPLLSVLAVCRKVLNSVETTVLVDGRHDYVDILRSFYRTTSNWEPLSVITVSSWSVEQRRNKLQWICNSYRWPSVIINMECQGSHMQHCGKVSSNQLLFSPRHQVWEQAVVGHVWCAILSYWMHVVQDLMASSTWGSMPGYRYKSVSVQKLQVWSHAEFHEW